MTIDSVYFSDEAASQAVQLWLNNNSWWFNLDIFKLENCSSLTITDPLGFLLK
jgi:hypothetical protein